MKLRHINCEDPRCKVCMEDHEKLQSRLEKETGIDTLDHLGHYHKWLSDHGVSPETEFGWASEETFEEENIQAYVTDIRAEYTGGCGPHNQTRKKTL